jgi:3-deoxy-manno-octulosonate cytidylyltransferase (CMP-KDO synthetase)
MSLPTNPSSALHPSRDPAPRVLGVIPARLASTRLPRKVLRELCGQPLLAWVVGAALRCPQLDEIVVAADSDEVAQLCASRQWRCLLTLPDLPSGSDRLFAVAREIPADIYVNIQADEPLLQPAHIEALLAPFARSEVAVTTLKVRCPVSSIADRNVVKVVTAADGRALYFSRATIPYDRDNTGATPWKHLGLYAYRKEALARFAALSPSRLEQTERLEQLRLLENGLDIHVAESPADTIGVDTEDDLLKVEGLLQQQQRSHKLS